MKSPYVFLVFARVLAALAVITIACQSAKAVEPPAGQTCATRFSAGCPTKCLRLGDRFDLEATTDAPFGQFVITDESRILSDLTLSAASAFGQNQTRSFIVSGSGSGTATIQFVSRDENNNVCGTATCQIVAGASCPPCTATLYGCPVRCVNVGETFTLQGYSSTGKGEFAPVFGFPAVVAPIPMANPWFNLSPIYSLSQGQSYTVVGPGTTMIEFRAIDEEGYVCDTEVCYIHAEDPCTTNPNDPPPPACDLSVELVGCPLTAKPHAIVPLEFIAYPDGRQYLEPNQRDYTFFWCVHVSDPEGQCIVHYCPNLNVPCPYSPDCPLGEVSTGFLNKLVLRAHPKWPQIRDMLQAGSFVHVSVKVRKLGCEACSSCYFEVVDGAGLTNGSDYDQDGYCDLEEVEAGSNPEDASSIPDIAYYADNDNDLVPKIYDVRTPPTADVQSTEEHFDTDKDGVIDFAEMDLGLDPYNPKSTVASDGTPIPDINSAAYTAPGVDDDRDMLYDEYEAHYGYNPNNADTDADGIRDGIEVRTGTDPFTNHHHESVDSDGDGLSDYEERLYYKSNTNDYDSDNDGLPDFFEVKAGFDPTKERSLGASSLPDGMLDLDGDGLSNADEYMYSTNALTMDSDGDGISDGIEIEQGSDAQDRNSSSFSPHAVVKISAQSNQSDKIVIIRFGDLAIEVPPRGTVSKLVSIRPGHYNTQFYAVPDNNIQTEVRYSMHERRQLVILGASHDSTVITNVIFDLLNPCDSLPNIRTNQIIEQYRHIRSVYSRLQEYLNYDDERTIRTYAHNTRLSGPFVCSSNSLDCDRLRFCSADPGNPFEYPFRFTWRAIEGVCVRKIPIPDSTSFEDVYIRDPWNEYTFQHLRMDDVFGCMPTLDKSFGPYFTNYTDSTYSDKFTMSSNSHSYQCAYSSDGKPRNGDSDLIKDIANSGLSCTFPSALDLGCGTACTANYRGFQFSIDLMSSGSGSLCLNISDPDCLIGNDIFEFLNIPSRLYLDVSECGYKILNTNSGDADADGIPNYADGFKFVYADFSSVDAPLEFQNKVRSPGNQHFQRMVFTPPLDAGGTVKFEYQSSDPDACYFIRSTDTSLVSFVTNPNIQFDSSSGMYRLWKKPGNQIRSALSVSSGGDYIPPGTLLRTDALENTAGGDVVVYLEALQPSASQDIIFASFTQSAGAPSQTGCKSVAVPVTAGDIRFVSFRESGSMADEPLNSVPELSQPKPTIHVSSHSVSGLRHSSNATKLIADVNLSGTVDDAAADLCREVTVDELLVEVNGILLQNSDGSLRTVPVQTVSKLGYQNPYYVPDQNNVLRPYDFAGGFQTVLHDIHVQPGLNSVRLIARNVYGISGSARFTFEVSATPPGPESVYISIDTQGSLPTSANTLPLLVRYGQLSEVVSLPRIAPGVFENAEMRVEVVDPQSVSLSPTERDVWKFAFSVAGSTLVNAVFPIVESEQNSGVFTLARVYEYTERDNYSGWDIQITNVSDVSYSDSGSFTPALAVVQGFGINPSDPLTYQDVTIKIARPDGIHGSDPTNPTDVDAVETYHIVPYDLNRDGVNDTTVLAKNRVPSLFVATPAIAVDPEAPSSSSELVGRARNGAYHFAVGVKDGVVDTGVSLWEGASEIVSTARRITQVSIEVNPLFYLWVSIAYDQQTADAIIEKNINDVRNGANQILDTIGSVIPILQSLLDANADVASEALHSLLTGQDLRFESLSPETQATILLVAEMLDDVYAELTSYVNNIDDYNKGWIVGRVLSEVAVQVAPAALTGGTSLSVTSTAVATRVSTALTSLPIIQKFPRVLLWAQRLPTLFTKYAQAEAAFGSGCGRLLRHLHRLERTNGMNRLQALRKVLDDVKISPTKPHNVKELQGFIKHALHEMYDEATSLDDVPTYRQLKEMMTGDLRHLDLNNHHAAVKEIATAITGNTSDAARNAIDDMPGFLLPTLEHQIRNAHPGKSFHSMLKSQLARVSVVRDLEYYRSVLRLTYSQFDDLYGQADGIDYKKIGHWADIWLQQYAQQWGQP